MRLFLAGSAGGEHRNRCWTALMQHRLISYVQTLDNRPFDWEACKALREKPKTNLFLDSGAFSAFTQNKPINIDDYISFIKENEKYLTCYANLDHIGKGEESAKKSYENQLYMESKGLMPIPCFHMGEPFSYLQRYVKNYKYIALGGMAADASGRAVGNAQRRMWLDQCFSDYICGKDGMPQTKVHGFGMTSFDLMFRYPWYSVDSTAWVLLSRIGQILVPVMRDGKYDYSIPPQKIGFSAKSPSRSQHDKHFDSLTPTKKQQVADYVSKHGFTIGRSTFHHAPSDRELKENERWIEKKTKEPKRMMERIHEPGLMNDYVLREQMNIIYFTELEKEFKPFPWKFECEHVEGSLF